MTGTRTLTLWAAALSLSVGVLVPGSRLVAAGAVPFLSGHVNDHAHLLDDERHDRLEQRLAAFEKATGAQVAVLLVDTLDGEPIEDYSMRVAEAWKLGRKGADDGVLLLVARADRAMRIEVGYGLEGKLPDALASRILANVVRPRMRAGQLGEGVEAGVDAITATLEGKGTVPAESPGAGVELTNAPLAARLGGMAVFTIVIGVFSLLALLGKGCQSWFLYLFLVPFWAVFPVAFFGPFALLLAAAWVVGFPLARLWLSKSPAGKRLLASHPDWVRFATASGRSGSGGGWSSGGGSAGGGGFSGGGGSFGGGGASSSW